MLKTGIFGIFLLVNAVGIFCVFNPWIVDWQAQGITLLILEGVFFLVIGLPVFLYHFIRKKKSFKQSLADSVSTVLDFLAGWV